MPAVAEAIFLTLAMRPVGAFLFGFIADRFGRRPALMTDIIAFSVFELASAFAPSLHVFLIIRACFGIAMGGEWGVGAALAFDTLPKKNRGFFSGLLQEGYVVGYLLAAMVYGTLFRYVGWRGMFVIGVLPAFLVIYIRSKVAESPAWQKSRGSREELNRNTGKNIARYFGSFLFLVVLTCSAMAARIFIQLFYRRIMDFPRESWERLPSFTASALCSAEFSSIRGRNASGAGARS